MKINKNIGKHGEKQKWFSYISAFNLDQVDSRRKSKIGGILKKGGEGGMF